MTSRAWMVAAACVIAGCSKDPPAGGAAAADAAVPASPVAEGGASANGEAGAPAAAGAAKSYAGKYSVAVGSMYVPDQKDWASVKFKNDESKLLGDGEMTLAVDASGRVTGSTEGGPLGASVLDGTSDGTTLTATVRRKDPSDEGLTGTLEAKVAGDTVEGTMKLAESNAAVVRVGKVSAKKK